MVLPWSGALVGGAGGCARAVWQADQDAGGGGECDMELVDVSRGGVELEEFLGACFARGRDQFEEWFIDELVICCGDEQGDGGEAGGAEEPGVALFA
jgi:hypothetical protein